MSRSGEHYMPRPDGDFAAWANAYYEAVKKWWDDQGLDTNDLKPLETALAEWVKDYPAHVKAQAAAEGARQAKDAARAGLEKQVRPITNFIQTYFSTTDADRAGMGITVRDASRTPGGAPASKPLVIVEGGGRLTHHLRLLDEGQSHGPTSRATKRARPRGAERAEVFVAFTPTGTPPPANFEAFRYVQSVSDGRAVLSFESPRGGMQAHYLARWVNRTGAMGPWSETSSATIAA